MTSKTIIWSSGVNTFFSIQVFTSRSIHEQFKNICARNHLSFLYSIKNGNFQKHFSYSEWIIYLLVLLSHFFQETVSTKHFCNNEILNYYLSLFPIAPLTIRRGKTGGERKCLRLNTKTLGYIMLIVLKVHINSPKLCFYSIKGIKKQMSYFFFTV